MLSNPAQNDPIGRLAVRLALGSLLALAVFASVYQTGAPAGAQTGPGFLIAITPTASLPTPQPALAPVVDLAAPTPAPMLDSASGASLPAPAWSAADLAGPPPPAEMLPEMLPQPSGDYIANVGAQAEHSPRSGPPDPPPAQTGPILISPTNGDPAYIVVPAGTGQQVPAAAPGIAAAVPPISAEQAAIIGARTSNTCEPGQIFMPRTGCYTPGSGGRAGAVGESRP